ncbi:MAG: hypothetical protein KTR31_11575 [Myxococcales bacterium]|nr:hypothetical protein [Myxococcales bacterium]
MGRWWMVLLAGCEGMHEATDGRAPEQVLGTAVYGTPGPTSTSSSTEGTGETGLVEVLCDDGIDNDGDGDTDCKDRDCAC